MFKSSIMKSIAALALVGLATLLAITSGAEAHILPKNNLWKQDIRSVPQNFSEAEFKAAIEQVASLYVPMIKAMGVNFVINAKWDDSTVNASAEQTPDRKTWSLNMYGGLARRPEVTLDAFRLVNCHELGHHLGGFPFYGDEDGDWAAVEGEADYFAAQVCAKRVFTMPGYGNPAANAEAARTVDPFAKKACDTMYELPTDRQVCYRTANASMALATLLGALNGTSGQLSFQKRDPSKVTETYDSHPEAQCRLDTYFSGSLCTANFGKNFIPGKALSNHAGIEAEREAAMRSCTNYSAYRTGLRPRCWFAPRL